MGGVLRPLGTDHDGPVRDRPPGRKAGPSFELSTRTTPHAHRESAGRCSRSAARCSTFCAEVTKSAPGGRSEPRSDRRSARSRGVGGTRSLGLRRLGRGEPLRDGARNRTEDEPMHLDEDVSTVPRSATASSAPSFDVCPATTSRHTGRRITTGRCGDDACEGSMAPSVVAVFRRCGRTPGKPA